MSEAVLKVAAKAVIVNHKNQVLIVRESKAHHTNTQSEKWGIPGGRLEKGESFFDALRREANEEVGLEVSPVKPIYVGEWSPVINGVTHQIIAIFYLCNSTGAEVVLSSEHDDYTWVDVQSFREYSLMVPDDLVLETAFKELSTLSRD